MPNVQKVLQDEISRLAKKEAKLLVEPVSEKVKNLEDLVRKQNQIIGNLRKELSKKQDIKPQIQVEVSDPVDVNVKIPKGSIKKYRNKLKLSQEEFGMLLGVSALTISNWETEKSAPSLANKLAFAELRKIGVREARRRIEMLKAAN